MELGVGVLFELFQSLVDDDGGVPLVLEALQTSSEAGVAHWHL